MNYSDFMALKALIDEITNSIAVLDADQKTAFIYLRAQVTNQGKAIMTAFDDLSAALAALKAETATMSADITAAVDKLAKLAADLAAAVAANNEPAVKAASDEIVNTTATLKAASDSLETVLKP